MHPTTHCLRTTLEWWCIQPLTACVLSWSGGASNHSLPAYYPGVVVHPTTHCLRAILEWWCIQPLTACVLSWSGGASNHSLPAYYPGVVVFVVAEIFSVNVNNQLLQTTIGACNITDLYLQLGGGVLKLEAQLAKLKLVFRELFFVMQEPTEKPPLQENFTSQQACSVKTENDIKVLLYFLHLVPTLIPTPSSQWIKIYTP